MRQGDIVTIEFPFSDLSQRKVRPALIISNDRYNKHKNVILAGIYGKKKPFSIQLTNEGLVEKRLNKESFISLQNIFSAERSLIGKSIDRLKPALLARVLRELDDCF